MLNIAVSLRRGGGDSVGGRLREEIVHTGAQSGSRSSWVAAGSRRWRQGGRQCCGGDDGPSYSNICIAEGMNRRAFALLAPYHLLCFVPFAWCFYVHQCFSTLLFVCDSKINHTICHDRLFMSEVREFKSLIKDNLRKSDNDKNGAEI